MKQCRLKTLLAYVLAGALLMPAGMVPGSSVRAAETGAGGSQATGPAVGTATSSPSPTPSGTPHPSVTPTQPVRTPAATAAPTETPRNYVLVSPKAKYGKSSQKGIHYKRVKGKKVYKITAYVTDPLTLTMSQQTVYSVYGAGSKSLWKKKVITVNKKGVVKCHPLKEDTDYYAIIQAHSRKTGEDKYIYIHYKKKVRSSAKKIKLYERYKETLKINYGKSHVKFHTEDEKIATVNKKGVVTAVKKGTTYITIKVKDSEKNQIRVKIKVTKEPWIVSSKDKLYDYEDMTRDLHKLQRKYPGRCRLMSLGESYDGRTIWCLKIGRSSSSKRLVLDGCIHAREWKNAQILTKQAEDILRDYPDFKKRFTNTCVYILPMVNPDGATISQYGYKKIRNRKLQKKIKKLGHNEEWKANARGVDLNDNFPSGWKKSKKVKKPAYMGYPGKKAASEKETKILMNFINNVGPTTVLNVHSTGSVIYWDFDVTGERHDKLQELAEKIHSYNKYMLMPKSGSTTAAGGFADWIVYAKGRTSVTIETGTGVCPLGHSEFKKIWKKNNKMFRWFITES